ncbi:MAG: DUF1730 domain-containing protein [Butyricicoccus pullicaecorum]|nr:DUF1730 domain-containing protein [Butyricicoccus pullicaecorum]MDO4669237.1 DUF1730 domain-containing protein [Butyricicoccus pullicaecorum]
MNILDSLCMSHGLCALGVCKYDTLYPQMSDAQRTGLARRIDHARSVLVTVLPYPAEPSSGNLSLYARARDYHIVLGEKLKAAADTLRAQYPCHTFAVLVDDSPLPEVYAAACAGLGKIGTHGLLIHPVYGSYVFIGTIVTDLELPATGDTPAPCLQCGACLRACPVDLDKSRCLSALTQQGGALSAEQEALVREHPLIWGCDTCQLVCPLNRSIPPAEIPDFTQNRICSLELSDLEGLTRKQFAAKYPDRAFTWRGPAPLRRNLTLKKEEN